jgi:hypothetical protein
VRWTLPSASTPAKATLTVHRPVLEVRDSIDVTALYRPPSSGT